MSIIKQSDEGLPNEKSVTKFKGKLKELCCRSWSVPMDYRIQRLNQTIRGWINYFRIGDINEYYTSRAPVIYINNASYGKILNGDYNGCC